MPGTGSENAKKLLQPTESWITATFGTPERTLTSDLSLRRRLLYTTELLRHINFWVNVYAEKDLNELPLRRRTLYPGELQGHVMKLTP